MRNLKRALSLAMASVMTLGMMTVGASAKGLEDFSDAAEIVNADAVAVTSAIGIFKGYDDGEFKGENVVTRAEMAVICAKLLYGADVDPAQFAGSSTFTDTPPGLRATSTCVPLWASSPAVAMASSIPMLPLPPLRLL